MDVFPHPSVEDHVLVIVLSWGHPPATVASVYVNTGVEQLSEVVAVPVFAGNVLAVHCIVTFAGHVIEGGVESSTKIVWIQVDVFPHPSVEDHVLVIVLSWGQPPATVASVNVRTGVEQLSEVVAVPVFAGNVLAVHWIVTLAGHVSMGAVLSLTVIVCVQVAVLLHPSVACQVLVIVRSWGQVPATVTSLYVTTGVEQLSDAVAVPVLAGSVLAEHSIVTFAGHVITGTT